MEQTPDKILVSIVIPCYNSAAYINRAIDSVFAQQYSNWELLLVDNGSTDNTLDILTRFSKQHPDKIKVLHQSIKGAPAARNMGLHNAKGAYVQFLDSDDEIAPEKIQEQAILAMAQQPAVIVGNSFQIKEEQGTITKKRLPYFQDNIWVGLITTSLGRTSSCLFQRDAVVAAGSWKETQTSSQEYELLFRIIKNGGRVVFSPGYHTTIFLRKESVHMSGNQAKVRQVTLNYINLRKDIRKHLQQNNSWHGIAKIRFNRHMLGYLLNISEKMPDIYTENMTEFGLKPYPAFFVRRWLSRTKRKLVG